MKKCQPRSQAVECQCARDALAGRGREGAQKPAARLRRAIHRSVLHIAPRAPERDPSGMEPATRSGTCGAAMLLTRERTAARPLHGPFRIQRSIGDVGSLASWSRGWSPAARSARASADPVATRTYRGREALPCRRSLAPRSPISSIATMAR